MWSTTRIHFGSHFISHIHKRHTKLCIIKLVIICRYSFHSNIIQLFHNINKELNELTDWFYANKLSLNVNKIKYSIFTRNRNIGSSKRSYQTKRSPIARENSIKCLGVYIDEHITWKTRINKVKTKLTSALFAINRTKQICMKLLKHYILPLCKAT